MKKFIVMIGGVVLIMISATGCVSNHEDMDKFEKSVEDNYIDETIEYSDEFTDEVYDYLDSLYDNDLEMLENS